MGTDGGPRRHFDLVVQAVDENGVENKLYTISDPESIHTIQTAFEDRSVYIAEQLAARIGLGDGASLRVHHRDLEKS